MNGCDPKLGRGYGNWVVGDQFYDRKIELELFAELMHQGANLLVVAPRRIGKTSLLRESERRLQKKYLCLQVDLQKANSPADAILELGLATRPHLPIWSRFLGLFSNLLDQIAGRVQSLKKSDVTVALRAGINPGNWQNKGDRLLELISRSERPVIIFLDELPILITKILKGSDFKITPERRDTAESLMSWIRSSSIRYQGKVRFVIAGSVGLRPVLQQAGLNATLNNFQAFPLGAWTADTAASFISEIAAENDLVLDGDVPTRMTELLGACIPHYVRMFFENVYRVAKLEAPGAMSVARVEEIYRNDMLGIRGRTELSHFEERLRLLGPEFYDVAFEILTEAAAVGEVSLVTAEGLASEHAVEGRSAMALTREALGILEHDGYLKEVGLSLYAFDSKLVRDWWRASYGKGFKCLKERSK
ncbi:MAG: hypothetical protein WB729_16745 [Candidatus Sulfotelmatobacter sp.]